MTEQRLEVGPLVVALTLSDETVALIGSYPEAGPERSIDARITVELNHDFVDGRVKSPKYPAFDSHLQAERVLVVERFDAKGTIDFADPLCLQASFVGHANGNTLEAILRIVTSIAMPPKSTLILHASAIESEGQAHLFAGLSGAGKSTIAELLSSHFKVTRLSDELLLLRKREGQWWLEVAPFSGKVTLPHGRSAPLASVNFLKQGPSHERRALGLHQAMSELPKHVVTYANHPEILELVLDLIGDIVESTPCYQLEFANNQGVGRLLQLPCL